MHHDHCPLCTSTAISFRFSATDHLVSRQTFSLYKCSDCYFQFTADYPPENEAGRYYESDDYISHTNSERTLFDKTYQLVRKIMLRRKVSLVRKVTGLQQGRILDIGSGTGHFLAGMKNEGWETMGIEINEKTRKYANSKFDLDTQRPENISELSDSLFDCITLWHVLEHFYEPFRQMEETWRLLKPGGKLIIALPNCMSYDARHYGADWAALDVPRHLWHFGPSTFRLFAQKTGFSIEKIRMLPFDVFYISILSEKHKGSRLSSLTAIIKGICFSALSLFRKENSSSLVYILRKEDRS